MEALGRFSVCVPAKWVLVGEHSVLRGGAALAFPYPELNLKLSFEPRRGAGFSVSPPQAAARVGDLLDAAMPGWRERAQGELVIESGIPLGAGLGSSAAFAVALARWWGRASGLDPSAERNLAKKVEDHLHGGRSSGMDLAAVSSGQPIQFAMEEGPRELGLRRTPRFTLHDSGARMATAQCIARVGEFRAGNPAEAARIDAEMARSFEEALAGLRAYSSCESTDPAQAEALSLLAQAMKRAHRCFEGWGLVPVSVGGLVTQLVARGARAAKVTGAGGGGMVCALWE